METTEHNWFVENFGPFIYPPGKKEVSHPCLPSYPPYEKHPFPPSPYPWEDSTEVYFPFPWEVPLHTIPIWECSIEHFLSE